MTPFEDWASTLPTLLGANCLAVNVHYNEVNLEVSPSSIVPVLTLLRDNPNLRFKVLIDVCGVDYLGEFPRFKVVYHLLSLKYNQRIRVKVSVEEREIVPSVTSVFSSANWYEREIWDLYGIPFSGHPDLRRIMTDYNFEGHPLRKDFPLTGYVEVRYNDEEKRVIYEPVRLSQDYRSFDFLSPWEGMIRQAEAGAPLPGDEKAEKND